MSFIESPRLESHLFLKTYRTYFTLTNIFCIIEAEEEKLIKNHMFIYIKEANIDEVSNYYRCCTCVFNILLNICLWI